MDLALSKEQSARLSAVRSFLEQECSEDRVRAMEHQPGGYSQDLWRAMVQRGWPSLCIPTGYGGSGLSFVDLALLVEEMGRALVPGPFLSTAIASVALLEAGNDEQKSLLLPRITAGEATWSIASLTAPAAFRAVDTGRGYLLSGSQADTPDGLGADSFLLRATLPSGSKEREGLVFVGATAPGLTFESTDPHAWPGRGKLLLCDTPAAKQSVLGGPIVTAVAIRRLAAAAAILQSAYLAGLAGMAAGITASYVKRRHQFGKPVASFQAIQHQAADNLTDLEIARLAAWKAAAAFGDGATGYEESAHIARVWVGDATRRILSRCMRMHGGISFAADYRLQLYYRRQLAFERSWGGAAFHRDRLREEVLR